ncbi:MAG: FAD-binding protein [Paracoccaceae bacterium]
MRPQTEAELAEVISGASGALKIVGGGTRPLGKPLAGEVLSVAGLSGIEIYEPGSLTLVARAGTPLAEIETALDEHNQRLAFEPIDHRGLLGTRGTPTIGGVVATNASGPRRVQVGACRDYLLGVRFVDGKGVVIKNGGRVMKNVTGYDLTKLVAGSYGTLGVLSEVAFKVLPKTDVVATLKITGLSDQQGQRALAAAMGSPFEITGAAHVPKSEIGAPVTLIRIEGFESSVAYRAKELVNLLSAFGDVEIETDQDRVVAIWKSVRDVKQFWDTPGDVWRISVKPSDAPDIAKRIDADDLLYDWAGGLIWALLPEGTDARALIGDFKGHATLIRASAQTRGKLPVFQPEPEPLAAITAGLREKFDPRGILNPGLMT